MIKRLRRKFILVVMSVVTLMLLAIFVAMLTTTQRNNERMSLGMLHQALGAHPSPRREGLLFPENRPFPTGANLPNMRLPVLTIEIGEDGGNVGVSTYGGMAEITAQPQEDIEAVIELVTAQERESGVIPAYELRYLKRATGNGVIIALADISIEREMLKTQVATSLLVGGAAMLVFFLLSIFLARWAVRPVETAWERQRQFITNASHELKTPLTVILSNADMLKSDKAFESEKNARRMEHIHAEAVRMRRLVEDMLLLAKSDSAGNSAAHVILDFSDIVKSAVLVYEPIVFDGGGKLTFEVEEGLTVMGDSQQLRQAMHILLDNAQKYLVAGGGVRVGLGKAERDTLLLMVENEGVPIPAEELEQIFLRFYRRDESRSEHGSFGLGLSIAQSIVNEHRGKIWAESDGNSKNRFYVSLPLQ